MAHRRGPVLTGGIAAPTPETLEPITNREFFQATGLWTALMRSPFEGNPTKALDFAFPEVAAERVHYQKVASFEDSPKGLVIGLVEPELTIEAVGELYERNFDRIYNYVLFRVGVNRPEIAEELTQDIFTRVSTKRGSFRIREGATVEGWLSAIAHNRVITYYRDAAKEKGPTLDEVDNHLGIAEEEAIVQKIEQEERSHRLRAAIEKLPTRQKAALKMKLYENLSDEEIAGRLGGSINPNSVRVLLYRGREGLKRVLKKKDFFPEE